VRIVIDTQGRVTEVGDGKPDETVATSIDPVPVYSDVRFLFEIVDGKGVVTKQ
jgi:hypothetical protein